MSIATYTELKTAVANWLARSDLTSRIPEFITIAESELNQKLRSRDMIASATVNPTSLSVALPTGYLETISFSDHYGEPLKELSMADIEELQYGSGTSYPRYYAIGGTIEFESANAASVNYTMWYYKKLDIATTSTNAVLTNYPNLYLYGALKHAEPFIMNDSRVGLWKSLYDEALRDINRVAARSDRKLRTDIHGEGTFNIIRGD